MSRRSATIRFAEVNSAGGGEHFGRAGSGHGAVPTARAPTHSSIRPQGAATDSAGNVYVADASHNTIRKITPAGLVSTFAGLADNSGSTDATGSNARFNYPAGVAVDTNGNVLVADRNNNRIRKITPNGIVSTVAGSSSGSADGTNNAAQFKLPRSVTADNQGNLYVADTGNNTIRRIRPVGTNWVVSTIAGLAGTTNSTDGSNSVARFNAPFAITVDAATNLYVVDSANYTIRKIRPVGDELGGHHYRWSGRKHWLCGRHEQRRALWAEFYGGPQGVDCGRRGQSFCRGHLQ